MQNCKHISQSPVKKARLGVICNLNGWTHTSREQLMLYNPISKEISSFLLNCCCLVQFSASSVLCLLNQTAKSWLPSRNILSCTTLITTDYSQEPGNVATIIGLWHNMQRALMYSGIIATMTVNVVICLRVVFFFKVILILSDSLRERRQLWGKH